MTARAFDVHSLPPRGGALGLCFCGSFFGGRALRERIRPLLGDVEPVGGACAAMLDEARRFYDAIELDPVVRQQTLAEMDRLRPEEMAACERRTSVRAAQCTRILLAERRSEFAWCLDQCSRAFPTERPGPARR